MHVASELLTLAGLLRLLLRDLTRQQLVGDRYGGCRADARAQGKTDHRDDQQLQGELCGHFDLVHADGRQHADLIFAFTDVQQGDDHQYHTTDGKHHDEQRQCELR